MAVKGKVKQAPLSDIIQEEAREAGRETMGKDDEFDPERDLGFGGHGPRAFAYEMRNKDQIVIDELLASLPKNQGYYLKLYRELLPGKWELKERIDQYDTWSDLEYEIAQRVKAMTVKFGPKKWGSGTYRLVVWKNGGFRDRDKYPPIDIVVDAGDTEDSSDRSNGRIDPLEATNEQLHSLGNMLNAVRGIMPSPADPSVMFKSIADAFAAGKGEKKDNDNLMMTMMMQMMTAMMTSIKDLALAGRQPTDAQKPVEETMARFLGILKDFQLINNPQGYQGPKTLTEQIADLKLLGIDPFKKEDMLDGLAKLKTLMTTVADVVPNGNQVERPGLMEKLIDALAPHVPKMIGDLKSITDNAAIAQQLQIRRGIVTPPSPPPELGEHRGPIPMEARPQTRYGQPIGPTPRMGAGDAFSEPLDRDPYSGFMTRPTERPIVERDNIQMFGPNDFATSEQLKAKATGQPISPTLSQEKKEETVAAPPVAKIDDPQPLPPLLQQLEVLVKDNIIDAYPALFQTLEQFEESKQMLIGIQRGFVTVDMMVKELKLAGGVVYNHPQFVEKLQAYLEGFIKWIQEYENGKIEATCSICASVHGFESRGHFEESEKVCGIDVGGSSCQGALVIGNATV